MLSMRSIMIKIILASFIQMTSFAGQVKSTPERRVRGEEVVDIVMGTHLNPSLIFPQKSQIEGVSIGSYSSNGDVSVQYFVASPISFKMTLQYYHNVYNSEKVKWEGMFSNHGMPNYSFYVRHDQSPGRYIQFLVDERNDPGYNLPEHPSSRSDSLCPLIHAVIRVPKAVADSYWKKYGFYSAPMPVNKYL
jgi:hypothetical protein